MITSKNGKSVSASKIKKDVMNFKNKFVWVCVCLYQKTIKPNSRGDIIEDDAPPKDQKQFKHFVFRIS